MIKSHTHTNTPDGRGQLTVATKSNQRGKGDHPMNTTGLANIRLPLLITALMLLTTAVLSASFMTTTGPSAGRPGRHQQPAGVQPGPGADPARLGRSHRGTDGLPGALGALRPGLPLLLGSQHMQRGAAPIPPPRRFTVSDLVGRERSTRCRRGPATMTATILIPRGAAHGVTKPPSRCQVLHRRHPRRTRQLRLRRPHPQTR